MNSIEDDRTYPMQEGEEGGQAPQNRNVSLRNLVLQCAHCKMIVGDTTHLVCTACVEGVNVVVLKGMLCKRMILSFVWNGYHQGM